MTRSASVRAPGPLEHRQRAGREVALSWPRPLPVPQVCGDTAVYGEVAPGVDLVVHAGVAEFSHMFVVKDAEAAKRPEVADLALDLRAKDLTVQAVDGGRLAAVDTAAGGEVFEAPSR